MAKDGGEKKETEITPGSASQKPGETLTKTGQPILDAIIDSSDILIQQCKPNEEVEI